MNPTIRITQRYWSINLPIHTSPTTFHIDFRVDLASYTMQPKQQIHQKSQEECLKNYPSALINVCCYKLVLGTTENFSQKSKVYIWKWSNRSNYHRILATVLQIVLWWNKPFSVYTEPSNGMVELTFLLDTFILSVTSLTPGTFLFEEPVSLSLLVLPVTIRSSLSAEEAFKPEHLGWRGS